VTIKSDIDAAHRRLHNLLQDGESRATTAAFFEALKSTLIGGSSFMAITARQAGGIEIEIRTPEDMFYDHPEEEV
jgi:hypothetical protein